MRCNLHRGVELSFYPIANLRLPARAFGEKSRYEFKHDKSLPEAITHECGK